MAEYIEREALLEKAKELAQNFSSSCLATPHIIKAIENAPKADVVEVVRCKERNGYDKHRRHCNYCGSLVFDDDFCSHGKRKEGAAE